MGATGEMRGIRGNVRSRACGIVQVGAPWRWEEGDGQVVAAAREENGGRLITILVVPREQEGEGALVVNSREGL